MKISVACYFDTIGLSFKRGFGLPPEVYAAVQGHDQVYPYYNKWTTLLLIHQPTSPTIDLLAPYRCSRFHLALDFYDTALAQFVVQRWHTGKVKVVKNTTYLGQANKRRNVASYSDQPSKINGRPCDHVEFRYATPDACRRRGAPTIGDVPNIDPVQLVLHETKLLKPVLAKLNEAVDRRVISNIATDKDPPSFKQLRAEFRQMMVRATGVEELDQIKSQQLRDWGFGEECFEVLDWVDYGLLDVVKYVNEYKVVKEELLLNHWRPNNKK